MFTYNPLTENQVAAAFRFIIESQDEDPRDYGVDRLPAFASRRQGVFHTLRSALDDEELDARASIEDELIAHIDGEAQGDAGAGDDEADRRLDDREAELMLALSWEPSSARGEAL
jgi:hypothetical protein